MMTILNAVFLSFLCVLSRATEVTVYNQDAGLIKETKSFEFKAGLNQIQMDGVATQIDATSVRFKSFADSDSLSVLEQNFQYDLASQDQLMNKYIGKEIEIERPAQGKGESPEILSGILLSNSGGPVLQVGKKIYMNPSGSVILPELAEGLAATPTLSWKIESKNGGKQDCEISYLTGAMNWNAEYVLLLNDKDDHMDMESWVTITNNSGATYKDAQLKLVDGDIHRAQQSGGFRPLAMARFAATTAEPELSEKPFSEYHLYTLQRPTTLGDGETKQINLAESHNIPIKKLFIYEGAQGIIFGRYDANPRFEPNFGISDQKKVMSVLEFNNSKENNLGLSLPKGRMRIYKRDSDGALEFVGEDVIEHTPKDEKIRLQLGLASDLVGERTRTSYTTDVHKHWFQESFEIKLRNHKDSDVVVTVVEPLYRWNNWKILESSQDWNKKDAQTIQFEVPVKKDGESSVTYSVKYSW